MSTRPEGWKKAEKPEGWGKRAPSPASTGFKHTATQTEDAEQHKQKRQAPKSATLPAANEAQSAPPTVPAYEEPQAQPIPEQPKITDEVPCIQSDAKPAEPKEIIFEKPAEKAPPAAKPDEKEEKQPKQKEIAAKSEKKKLAPKEAKPASKKKKRTVLLVSLIALAAVGGILCWLLLQKDGSKEDPPYGSVPSTTTPEQTSAPSETQSEPTAPSETQSEPTVPSETQPEPTVPPETQPEPTAPSESQPDPVVDLSGFAGCWHVSSDSELDGGVRDRELYITRIDERTCSFNLWYYRMSSIEDVLAEIHGNIADFSYVGYNGESMMEGSLTFGEGTITLTIRASDFVNMPAETIVFDGKHNSSWGYSSWPVPPAPEETTDAWCHIWCPDCGRGWFIPDSEIGDHQCPTCGCVFSECSNCGDFCANEDMIDGMCPNCYSQFNDPPDVHSQEFLDIAGYYEEYDYLLSGYHVEKENWDGYIYLFPDGSASIYASGTTIHMNWDVGVLWDATGSQAGQVSFKTDGEYLTMYLNNNQEWIFKKVY